jgi:hypothetical protein
VPERRLIVHRDLEEHLEPLLLRTGAVAFSCALVVLALIVLVCVILPSSVGRVAVSTTIFVATVSAALAASSFRLRDIRKRRGNLLRSQQGPEADLRRAQLPPRETIARRFRVSSYGIAIGLVGLLAAAVIGFFTSDSAEAGSWYAVAALLGTVFTVLTFVAATYTRPLD